jgi:hypothetical protein
VVQDSDLRTLLEIKGPEAAAAAAARAAAAAKRALGAAGIAVPTFRLLPPDQIPDLILQRAERRPAARAAGGGPAAAGGAPAAAPPGAAAPAARAAAVAAALRPDAPYFRYVQPTPDDQDMTIEYDLDEEDEAWLERYNDAARRATSRAARYPLSEAWMEALVDRMEKEYTAALQRAPERWVLGGGEGGEGGGGGGEGNLQEGNAAPPVRVPPVEEVFPLDACLRVPGINHYEPAIRAVYQYWRAKHARAGRPLIQRLWYEPPWHRKKAAQRLEDAGGDEPRGGGAGGAGGAGSAAAGPFAAHDSPGALAGIRKRRMDAPEVRSRFEAIRRDLEAARTLADQCRRREKLKLREAQILSDEWAARMAGECRRLGLVGLVGLAALSGRLGHCAERLLSNRRCWRC